MPSLKARAEAMLAEAMEEGGIQSDTRKSIFRECVERAGRLWCKKHPGASYLADGAESMVEAVERSEKAERQLREIREAAGVDPENTHEGLVILVRTAVPQISHALELTQEVKLLREELILNVPLKKRTCKNCDAGRIPCIAIPHGMPATCRGWVGPRSEFRPRAMKAEAALGAEREAREKAERERDHASKRWDQDEKSNEMLVEAVKDAGLISQFLNGKLILMPREEDHPWHRAEKAEKELAERKAALNSIYQAWKAWQESRAYDDVDRISPEVTALDVAIDNSGARDV